MTFCPSNFDEFILPQGVVFAHPRSGSIRRMINGQTFLRMKEIDVFNSSQSRIPLAFEEEANAIDKIKKVFFQIDKAIKISDGYFETDYHKI